MTNTTDYAQIANDTTLQQHFGQLITIDPTTVLGKASCSTCPGCGGIEDADTLDRIMKEEVANNKGIDVQSRRQQMYVLGAIHASLIFDLKKQDGMKVQQEVNNNQAEYGQYREELLGAGETDEQIAAIPVMANYITQIQNRRSNLNLINMDIEEQQRLMDNYGERLSRLPLEAQMATIEAVHALGRQLAVRARQEPELWNIARKIVQTTFELSQTLQGKGQEDERSEESTVLGRVLERGRVSTNIQIG